MTKTELISRVAKQANLTRSQAAATLKSLVAAVHESLKENGEIRISELGTFRVSERKARKGINPRTLDKMNIPAVKSVRFRSAKSIKDAIKTGEQKELALDVRSKVQKLCRKGDVESGFDLAMKSLLEAEREFGKNGARTAQCVVTLADAAMYREKYNLARVMDRRALSIQERTQGPSHPDVVHCKTALARLV
ncbi:MAG: DNA-binding protein HU-beta [Thermodesulfobacteriota bacterium]|nr:DNA-binding protein HU-beta [Thermodesulfobacteriota bacterium]